MFKIPNLSKLVLLTILVTLSGCATNSGGGFNIKSLAKSELDMVIDIHITQVNQQALELMKKLYKRNPSELSKAPKETNIQYRSQQIFSLPRQTQFAELNNNYGNDALKLAFSSDYQGDRVFAFTIGITGMLHASYNFQDEFFILDEIDQQKVYNSARNLETANWLLNNAKSPEGKLYLLSNSDSVNKVKNYSYERLIGKMISTQDILAKIIANKNNRVINKVVHGFASTTLLPI